MTEQLYLKTISIVLEKLSDASPRYVDIYSIVGDITDLDDTPPKNEVIHMSQKICDKLYHEGIADLHENGGYKLKITQKGIDIINSGGYLLYVENKAKQDKINNDRQLRSDEQALWTLRQTKLQVKWFKPMTIIAFIGGLISIYTTIQSIIQQSTIDKLEIQTKSLQHSIDSLKSVHIIYNNQNKSN